MCGIMAVVYRESQRPRAQQSIDKLCQFLIRRGHDQVVQTHYKLSTTVDWCISVLGCVLHMRGVLTPQPFQNDDGDWILWNGEIFESSSFVVDESDNDTSVLLSCLTAVQSEEDILHVMNGIRGPWSMIYFQANSQSLWFGRDVLGRRSLIWHTPVDSTDLLIISSVADSGLNNTANYWEEVPVHGVYRLILSEQAYFTTGSICCYRWKERDSEELFKLPDSSLINIDKKLFLVIPFQKINKSLTQTDLLDYSTIQTECSERLLHLLQESVQVRISAWKGSENIGILFSGGLDSVILAALADKCLDINKEIDLINVAFSHNVDFNKVPDRIAATEAINELNSKRKWNLILVNVTAAELIEKSPHECSPSQYKTRSSSSTKIFVEHSVETVEQWRAVVGSYSTLDQIVSMTRALAFNWLQGSQHIHNLIHPLNTVMDDSIGCALWFAARGKGILHETGKQHETNCKILLVGMGADEQFGGYSRHRTAYQKGGWECVLEEITKDIQRISTRNLGRDDRCISDHHREARYPYLDERVINYANSLPIWIKTDYTHQKGLGEKIILRKVASQLGLIKTAGLAKKAIQFGSHIAKISGSTGIQHSGQKQIF